VIVVARRSDITAYALRQKSKFLQEACFRPDALLSRDGYLVLASTREQSE
jgi:hypothetical protein